MALLFAQAFAQGLPTAPVAETALLAEKAPAASSETAPAVGDGAPWDLKGKIKGGLIPPPTWEVYYASGEGPKDLTVYAKGAKCMPKCEKDPSCYGLHFESSELGPCYKLTSVPMGLEVPPMMPKQAKMKKPPEWSSYLKIPANKEMPDRDKDGCRKGEAEIGIMTVSMLYGNEIGVSVDGYTIVKEGSLKNHQHHNYYFGCLPIGTSHTLGAMDSFGDGWHGGYAQLLIDDVPVGEKFGLDFTNGTYKEYHFKAISSATTCCIHHGDAGAPEPSPSPSP